MITVTIAAVAALGWRAYSTNSRQAPTEGFISGNGRIEATQIDVSAKLPGRIEDILVQEGEFVQQGQVLARMQTQTLDAQRDEATASQGQAQTQVAAAQAQISLRRSDVVVAQAAVVQREAELDSARRRFARTQTLAHEGAVSMQSLDDDRASVRSAEAALAASRAQVVAAQAAVEAAQAQATGAESAVTATQATIARIQADIDDSALVAPRDARVQLRIAQVGEVIGAGGKVLNLIDLADVTMTFFVPETVAGRVALGADVRIVLDAVKQVSIPAKVSFVASVAQFTPKTVETGSEREKLMFRVKAQIEPALLRRYREQVKTGVPGVAWVRLDPQAPWPASLPPVVTE